MAHSHLMIHVSDNLPVTFPFSPLSCLPFCHPFRSSSVYLGLRNFYRLSTIHPWGLPVDGWVGGREWHHHDRARVSWPVFAHGRAALHGEEEKSR